MSSSDQCSKDPFKDVIKKIQISSSVIVIRFEDPGPYGNDRAVTVHLKVELSSVQVPKSGRN